MGKVQATAADKKQAADAKAFYHSLYRIRRVEEEIARIYPQDKIQSPVHLSIGQEAVSVGVCSALRSGDIAYGSYRSHALYLAKGGDLKRMIAELYGKATGCARGKAGSMHIIDVAAGVMGASAVVATTIPLAVGSALAIKMRGEDKVVAAFFGDGAVEEGVFHESLNFAALKNLPVLFICENNFYAIHSPQKHRQSSGEICNHAAAHGIPAKTISSMDVFAMRDRMAPAVDHIRAGKGPQFFECRCYRWMEHVGPNRDFNAGYRSIDEARPWMEADEMQRVGGMLDGATRSALESEVETEIKEAFDFAEHSPFPDESELHAELFKE